MKWLLSLLILISNFSIAQKVTFQLRWSNGCDTTTRLDSSFFYSIVDLNDNTRVFNEKDGILVLPRKGRYKLEFPKDADMESKVFEVKDSGLFLYSYTEPKLLRYPIYSILRGIYLNDPPSIYVYCGKRIEGYSQDFYSNGNLRVRGNFSKGSIKDSLVTFYESGRVKKRVTYFNKKIKIEYYDTLSRLIKKSLNKRGQYLTDYSTREYYFNGKLKLDETKNEKEHLINEYYPNGRLKIKQGKNKREEFFENGSIKTVYSWIRRKDNILKGYDYYTTEVKKFSYDKQKMLTEEMIFTLHGGPYYPDFSDEPIKHDWIIKLVRYENGKKVFEKADFNPKSIEW